MNTFCTEQYDFSYFSFGDIGLYFFVLINMFKGDSSFFFFAFFPEDMMQHQCLKLLVIIVNHLLALILVAYEFFQYHGTFQNLNVITKINKT